jgi:hypothetical protein
MIPLRQYWKWAIFVVAVLAAALVILDLAMSLGATCPPSPASQCSFENSATSGAIRSFVEFVEHGEHFFVAFGTIVLGFATVFLWLATRALVEGAEVNADRQLRAYVMIRDVIIDDFETDKIPRPRVTIKNSGLTPARNVTVWCTVGFDHYPHTLPLPRRPQDALPLTPIAPQGTYTTEPKIKQGELTLATWAALEAGTHAIYVMGEIRYEDVFGQRRETDFLLFTGGPIGARDAMGAYKEGNRIT